MSDIIQCTAGNITSPALWRNVKLALLLSLVSINDLKPESSHPLHIFIASDLNEPVLTRLLSACASLKRSSVWRWSAHYSDTKDIITTTKNSLSFPLASSVKSGVLLSRFSSASAKTKTKNLVKTITSLDFQEKRIGGGGDGLPSNLPHHQVSFSWNSVVWLLDEGARYSLSSQRKQKEQNHESQLLSAAIQVSKTFDLVIRPDTTDQVHETLSYDLLLDQTPIQLDKEVEQAQLNLHQHLSTLLHEISLITVTRIPDSVVDFLSSYLSRLRMALDGSCVSFSLQELVDVLEKTCKAHAKLCKRSKVHIEDAVVAIYLLEESLWIQHGVGLIDRLGVQYGDQGEMDIETADCSKFDAFHEILLEKI